MEVSKKNEKNENEKETWQKKSKMKTLVDSWTL